MGQFSAINATPGTAIAGAITAAFSSTAALFTMRNANQRGLTMALKRLRLICAVAPASATSFTLAFSVDKKTRYSSGGTLIVPKPLDSGFPLETFAADVYFGAVVLNAASEKVKYLDYIRMRHAIPVVGDQYDINFGAAPTVASAMVLNGTNPQTMSYATGDILIAPGDTFSVHAFYPSNAATAPQFEFSALWDEKS